MTHAAKSALLMAALESVNQSVVLLEAAKKYQFAASQVHIRLNQERSKVITNPGNIRSLKLDRDWLLHKADDFHRAARRRLRKSKRLAWKARWVRG